VGNLRQIIPLGNTAHPDTNIFDMEMNNIAESVKYAFEHIINRQFVPCMDSFDLHYE
jgi:hypothetical protein